MHVFSKFEIIPSEVLEEIVLCAAESSFLGPPTVLASLLRVSRPLFEMLARRNNPYLYARVCCGKFDTRRTKKRLVQGDDDALELGNELVRRCEGMKRLRRNTYPRGANDDTLDGGFRIDLWMAYLMFLESDGKNAQQLIKYAHVDRLAMEFVRPGGRLHDGAPDNEGWTVDSEVNALALWLFWFTDAERVKFESAAERDDILGALGCLYAGSFKYASTNAPFTLFHIPSTNFPPEVSHGSIFPLSAWPFSPSSTAVPDNFGRQITLTRPLVTPPALLCCVARLGYGGSAPSPSRTPATRAEALRVGWTGPTKEDYEEFGRLETRGVEWGEGERSSKHEHDWSRLMVCHNLRSQPAIRYRVFTPGMLDGLWDGRWLATPPDYFQTLLYSAQEHERVETHLQVPIFQQPMQFIVREHHQHDAGRVVPFDDLSTDGEGAGALRAWLPEDITTTEDEGQLRIYHPRTKARYTYVTYDPLQATLDDELPPAPQILDIILTAQTAEGFGDAWGHDRYVGRVRQWDGLVVLVRNARPGAGRWVFRGYIHGNQNLVGRWRETGTPVNQPGWEGVWSMVKRPT